MQLAGIPIRDIVVLKLALKPRRADYAHTADMLEAAVATGRQIVALTIEDREAILAVLVDPLETLAELRAVLLAEHTWRRAEGL